MFSKPINLILVYIVTTCNIVVLMSPFLAVITPFIQFRRDTIIIQNEIYQRLIFAILLLAFLVSFFMLGYLVLDFLFGFSVRASLKGCTRYEKIKDFDFLSGIFDQVKNKFSEKSVRLYIKNSDEINAFAVSSVGRKAIVLTRGLVNHYLVECSDPKNFLYALRSIMGHEMSHLINKDFLPSFLIISNQKITNFASGILYMVFRLTARVMAMLPFGGRASSKTMNDAYSILNLIITSFNRLVVYNIYELLRRFISRSLEYRCDAQSAKAFGGRNMALALSMLGESGYFTLFSTHPGTKKRMQKVENIKISDSVVRPKFIDSIANYFSIMFLVIICLYFAKAAQVDLMAREYIRNHELINRKLSILWHLISRFF